MKKLIVLTLMGLSAGGAFAQTAGGANNQSSSSATTSAQGNTQAVNFNSNTPADTTTRSTLNSNQNINNTGATTNTVDYRGSYTIKNVPSVNGPNLTTSNDTCMGSTSASANGPGVGISFGTTWTDEHCKRLKMSRELWNKGMKAASLAMDCMDSAAMAALEMTGTKCPQSMTAAERVSAFGPYASPANAAAQVIGQPVAAMAPPVQAVAVEQAQPQPAVALAPPMASLPPPAAVPVAAPAPAPLPLPQAPVVQAAPAPQPVAAVQPAQQAQEEQYQAAVAMPVELASVPDSEPLGEIASAPQAAAISQ
ncbi:hypothetical protein M2282_004269 [Variovorax boronicumulans]|uniref:hypothetical protein n=1 Tax=Variovorax boronicumulans TaxID=436515 RepID=UPI002475F940|nr:hypothetical protein [Variovorax boronicumulans]MDH6169105.1 hypothetical protein [Variovorax boronicumulans]